MLNRGEHGVTGYGTLAVGKATDADVLRHPKPHSLDGIENANSRIVVDGKEGIRIVVAIKQLRRDQLGILTVVADTRQVLIELQATLQQGILIAIEAVLRDLQLHRRPVEGNAPTPRLYQIGHGIEGSHIVVDHHPTGIHTSTDTVVEHHRNARVYQLLEMFIALGVLRLRHNNAAHLLPMEHLADADFTLVLLIAQCHHDIIATSHCSLFDTCQY